MVNAEGKRKEKQETNHNRVEFLSQLFSMVKIIIERKF